MSSMGLQEISHIRKQQKALSLRKLPALARQQMDHAELPAMYLAARTALQQCCRVDEVKDVKDRHEAIALYAKQAKDTTLLYYAERIKLRAIERIGELLSEIPDHKERAQTAKRHGIAYNTAARAVDIVRMPERVRTTLIETTPPPTYGEMAQYAVNGYNRKSWRRTGGFLDLVKKEEAIKPTCKSRAYELYEWLENDGWACLNSFLRDGWGEMLSVRDLARSINPSDARYVRSVVTTFLEFLDEFEMYLPKETDDSEGD